MKIIVIDSFLVIIVIVAITSRERSECLKEWIEVSSADSLLFQLIQQIQVTFHQRRTRRRTTTEEEFPAIEDQQSFISLFLFLSWLLFFFVVQSEGNQLISIVTRVSK
jgi:hypothetical protein